MCLSQAFQALSGSYTENQTSNVPAAFDFILADVLQNSAGKPGLLRVPFRQPSSSFRTGHREEADIIVVFFTDGRSGESSTVLEDAVDRLRAVQASISVVGIEPFTTVQQEQLALLADSEDTNFDIAELEDAAAEGSSVYQAEIVARMYESHPVSETTVTPALGFTCEFQPLDVILVLDGSGSVGQTDWGRQVSLFEDIVSALPVQQGSVR